MDLDNLFKKELEEPGNYKQYHEGDWNALEAMLDQHKKRSGIIYWMPLVSGIAALLILASGWFLINPSATKHQSKLITKTVKHGYKNKLAGDNVAFTYVTIPGLGKSNTGTGGRPMQQRLVLKKQFKLAGNHIAWARPKNKSFLTLSAVEAGHVTGQIASNISPVRETTTLTAVDEQVFPQDELNNVVAFNALTLKPAGKVISPKAIKKTTVFRPQMGIMVLASSNINGVGSFSDSQAGTNGGILFSVGFTKRFSISTGAIYAKTPYSTAFANYHTEYPFKTNPESVNADCRVLDIPLNVDYNLISKGRNSFSIGSGLSSYIMLRENYHYNYPATASGYSGPANFDLVNKNQYFMGVLNIDATYQRKLNSKLSLALQPYLKLPLTDIGNGGVKLQTTGMSVGLAWNINSFTKH